MFNLDNDYALAYQTRVRQQQLIEEAENERLANRLIAVMRQARERARTRR
jgi:hypothetical protein